MSFLLPFLVGTIVGGVVTWQVDRQRQQGENGKSLKQWFSRNKDQSNSSAPQSSEADSPDTASDTTEASGTGSGTSSQTPYGT